MKKHLTYYITESASRATGLLFLLNAIIFSSWVVRIPDIKYLLGLNDAEIGLALLAAPCGVILFTPVTTIAINRLGIGRVALISGFGLSFTLILLGLIISYAQLITTLFFFGLFNGVLDISMNGLASAIEKQQNRIIMSASHGFWSLGAAIGAILGSFLAGIELSMFLHFISISSLSVLLIISHQKIIIPIVDQAESTLKWVWPGWQLTILITIAFLTFMIEGGIADWNALFYEEILGSPVAYRGFGFAAFAGVMAVARFAGDAAIERFSEKKLLLITSGLAAVSLLLFAQAHSLWLSTFLMAICGLACSVIVPIVFRAAVLVKRWFLVWGWPLFPPWAMLAF
jgi:MFS family permease